MNKVTIIIIGVFLIGICIIVFYKNAYRLEMLRQIELLSRMQISSGAIKDSNIPAKYNPELYKVTPYFANISATSMLNSRFKKDNVEKYIRWYLSHVIWTDKNYIKPNQINGMIFDYYVSNDGNEL